MIHHGDCVEVMAAMEPESVDAIVTDPPYSLAFMGKAWDKGFGHAAWAAEAFRVAKPGAYLLGFGGTRTYHRLAAAIEDAGWEIRDCLVWAYASGFPKSLNLTGEWQGWGTALKPAWEPIVMARKPLRGTVARNVTEYGTGALNIDGTRIPFADAADAAHAADAADGWDESVARGTGTDAASIPFVARPGTYTGQKGRWPANVILTDPIFDGGVEGVVGGGETASGKMLPTEVQGSRFVYGRDALAGYTTIETYGDSGTYSRFFLIPKADRADREPVLGGLPSGELRTMGDGAGEWSKHGPGAIRRQNVHPTVKPTELMRHLVRLVTPPGGTVLDPFLGSGTTALAAEMEGFAWIGIEREAEYVAIAEARLNGTQKGLGLAG